MSPSGRDKPRPQKPSSAKPQVSGTAPTRKQVPPPSSAEIDPRHLAAQKWMRKAEEKLTDKKSRSPDRRRESVGLFNFGWIRHHFAHVLGLTVALTFAGIAAAWCYYLLQVMLPLARAIALPTGLVCAAALSYTSAYFLAAVQVAFEGADEIEELPAIEWREWFWTLPSTLGMLIVACLVGYGASLLLPVNKLAAILVAAFWLFPFLQLSVLETGSALAPFSKMVAATLFRHPVQWIIFYLQAALLGGALVFAGWYAWRDPPYLTVLVLGPLVAVGIVVYARMLGGLAWRLRKASLA